MSRKQTQRKVREKKQNDSLHAQVEKPNGSVPVETKNNTIYGIKQAAGSSSLSDDLYRDGSNLLDRCLLYVTDVANSNLVNTALVVVSVTVIGALAQGGPS